MRPLRLALLPLWLGWRYVFSRRHPTVVNVLSGIAVAALGLGGAAMLLVLSVFNGFRGLMQDVFLTADPDLRIEASRGRWLPQPDSLVVALQALPYVAHTARVLEGRALLRYYDRQALVLLRGVPPHYPSVSRIATRVVAGTYRLGSRQGPELVLGAGVANQLGINLADRFNPLEVLALTAQAPTAGQPEQALGRAWAFPAGVFTVQKSYDDVWALAPDSLVAQVLGAQGQYSALEVVLSPDAAQGAEAQLRTLLGATYRVLNRTQQHEQLYKLLQLERRVGFLLLLLILLLLCGTAVGGFTMITLHKQKDWAILRSMGFGAGGVRAVVLAQASCMGVLATALALGLGGLLGWLQQQWGLVRLQGSEHFLVEAFPVVLHSSDFWLVALTVTGLAVLSGTLPALRAVPRVVADRLRV